MAEEEEQPKGFQVRDRRRFTETGDVREDRDDVAPESKASPTPKAEVEAAPVIADVEHAGHEHADHQDVPLEITLSTFLMSLSTQALMCLGDIPNPVTGKAEPDLAAVRELIDIIALLQDKTRGNLDPQEARLFEKILFDLRMRFVEKSRK